jgi:phage baseplate assembly protein gpV
MFFTELVEAVAQAVAPGERRVYGVVLAQVISNFDATGQGRVQLRLPWLPGVEPWARVAVFSAGSGHGAFFIPQSGDEVLVAFNHGDVEEPFVLGSLWNGQDTPPARGATDPVSKRIIRTPLGHELRFDDQEQTVTIETNTHQRVKLTPRQIELVAGDGAAKITLEASGRIVVQASTAIDLKAPRITLDGTTLELKASASAKLNGGTSCSIQAGLVKIN